MDPITIVTSLISTGQKLLEIAEEVQENREEAASTAAKVSRLLPLIHSLTHSSDFSIYQPVLQVLSTLIQDTNEFLTRFIPIESESKWKKIIKMAEEAINRTQISLKFEGINKELDSILTELSTHQNVGLNAKLEGITELLRNVDLQQVNTRANMLTASEAVVSIFKREPEPEDSDDEQSVLGVGAFGVTHKMINNVDQTICAVKVVHVSKAAKSGVDMEQLRLEADMLKQMCHTNVVKYYMCFSSKNDRYFNIAMEYLDGGSLRDHINQGGVAIPLTVKWLQETVSALDYVHNVVRVLHRDLKPEHIMLTKMGQRVKLIDFSLSCVVSSSSAGCQSKVGATTYASYEKSLGKPYDGRDDMWAVGLIFSEVLTGQSQTKCLNNHHDIDVNMTREALVTACLQRDEGLGQVISSLLSPYMVSRPTSADLVQVTANLSTGTMDPRLPSVPLLLSTPPAPPIELTSIQASNDGTNFVVDLTSQDVFRATESLDIPVLNRCCYSKDFSISNAAVSSLLTLSTQEIYHDRFLRSGTLSALVHLLSEGSIGGRESAARALRHLGVSASLRLLVHEAGAVPGLVRLLSGNSAGGRKSAAAALRNLACNDSLRVLLHKAGAVPGLVHLLSVGSAGGKESAAGALRNFSCNDSLRVPLYEAGAVPGLVRLLSEGTADGMDSAAGALRNLVANASLRVPVHKAGAVPGLVRLLSDGSVVGTENAAGALRSLVTNATLRVPVYEAGCLPGLVHLLCVGTAGGRESAAGVLRNLACDDSLRVSLYEAGAVPGLVTMLSEGSVGGKETAAGALRNLVANASLRVPLHNAGAVPGLVRLLSEGSVSGQESAAGALRNLSCDNSLRVPLYEAGAAPALVYLLSEGSSSGKDSATGALRNLARNAECLALMKKADEGRGVAW